MLSGGQGEQNARPGTLVDQGWARAVANEIHAPSNMLCTTLANAMGVPLTDFGSAATGKPGELAELKR